MKQSARPMIRRLFFFATCKCCKGLIGIIVMGLAMHLKGQTISITKGTQFPDTLPGRHYNWFLNTDSMQVYTHKAGQWRLVSDRWNRIDSISTCNELVILHSQGEKRKAYILYDQVGSRHEMIFDYFCGQEIFAQRNLNRYMMLGSNAFHEWRREQLSMQYDCDLSTGTEVVPDTVQGRLAFCAPHFEEYKSTHWYCNELRNWGMLDEYGKWLIEPKYDAFFYFQNGKANVMFKGKKRKINEKGAFVR